MTAGASTQGTLDEAYDRIHHTGPERGGWLSNHAPMAVEALARHGHAAMVHRWIDFYADKLEDFPGGHTPIEDDGWREALGDPRRIADWIGYFSRVLDERPWRAVLETWWPRLLPGIAAGATHGVIRAGHATRALLDGPAHGHRLAELAHALGYWAARWQQVPGATDPRGAADPARALAAVPRIADQSGGIRERLARLTGTPGWPAALVTLRAVDEPQHIQALLADLVTAATMRYLSHGHGNEIMLIHAATAPNAVLRTLPALPTRLWGPSLTAAWAASAAVTAVYTPAEPAPTDALPVPPTGRDAADEVFARAVAHRDEHVIKMADTAVDVYRRTGTSDALAAALRAINLVERR